ncbi:MAG: type II toxin-antitoxin system HicA family toxin [Candidatus Omnitrophota bacterium]|nr:MAG: type II toxin-antitoxin system HicA family toxin [Candidatus Omnitrophota bacterium]
MNARHRRTLLRIFEKPDRSDIRWSEIEALFTALGATIQEGRGSRVRILFRGIPLTFHRPHPHNVINKSTLKDIRYFLKEMEIEP